MVDENTQTDAFSTPEIRPKVESAKVEEKKTTSTIWIPLKEENLSGNTPSQLLEVERNIGQKRIQKKPTISHPKHDLVVEEYKIQKDKLKTESECNLLGICSRFLSSPILQILDLSVLSSDE